MVQARGISVLYEPMGGEPDPDVDIVFVHGFTGDPKATWTLEKAKVQKRRREDDDGTRDTSTAESSQPPAKFPRIHSSFSCSKIRQSLSQGSTRSDTISSTLPPKTNSTNPAATDKKQYGDVYWPQDLLPSTVPNARVLTYGYDTKIKHFVQGQVSRNTVHCHAWDLLCTLEAKRTSPGEKSRPLVFIAHSLGGLVVKHMLKQARDRVGTHAHLHEIMVSTVAILFFGTPHHGADPRSFLHHVLTASALGLGVGVNKQIVATLMPNGEPVSGFADFAALACQQNWAVYSFQEEYGVTGLFGKKVVDDNSSCLALPTIETTQHIGDNHMDMCRFFGLGDPGYQKVAAALHRILARTISKPASVEIAKADPSDNSPSANDPSKIVTSSIFEPPFQATISPETIKALIELLRFDQIDARLMTLRTAKAKTCEWFLSNPEYMQWQSNDQREHHSGLLWIKGKPGAGKSVLMKYLFSEAKKASQNKGPQRPIVISFFFNARGEMLEQSTLGCYRSLLLQLFEKAPELQVALDDLSTSTARFIEKNGWNPETLTQVLTCAIDLLSAERPLTCFVDALDECEEWEVRNMVSFFEDLGDRFPASRTRLNICFSSRHYPSIVPKKGLQVTLETEADHFQDISHFVEAELKLGDSTQAEEIKGLILAKCSNIFLWVALVVPLLNRVYDRGKMTALRNTLDSIPPGLDQLFDMILTRDTEDLDELRVCLRWILFATRPLKPQELYVAIKIGLCIGESRDPELSEIEYPKGFLVADLHRNIENSSKGLAEITRSEKQPTVQFIHESVRDFLLGKSGKRKPWSGFGPEGPGETQNLLKSCCLSQLRIGFLAHFPTQSPPARQTVRLKTAKYPFLEYAIDNVLRHSESAEQENVMSQREFLSTFPLSLWICLFNSIESHEIRRHPADVNLVYILASYNLPQLIRIHPGSPRHLDIRGGRYEYPLLAALIFRNIEAIEALLITSGMATSPTRGFWNTPLNLDVVPTGSFKFKPDMSLLSCLVEFDQPEMVKHYLEKMPPSEPDVAAHRGRFGDYLQSVRSRRMALCLVGAGYDPGAEDDRSMTLLHHAAAKGHLEVVELLSSPHGEVNCHNSSPLSGDLISLIQARVRPNIRDCLGWTPFHHAASGGFADIVRHLACIPGVNPNEITNNGETALHIAARSGMSDAAAALLSLDNLTPDCTDKTGHTPLMVAATNSEQRSVDRNKVIKILITKLQPTKHNCQVLAEYLVACRASISTELAETILLFETQIINMQDKDGVTPLSSLVQDFASNSSPHTWRLLQLYLSFNANPNIRDLKGRSAIFYAAGLPWDVSDMIPRVLPILLDPDPYFLSFLFYPNADFSPDIYGKTPLVYAAEIGSMDNLRTLINDSRTLPFINTPDKFGQTPLWHLLNRTSLWEYPKHWKDDSSRCSDLLKSAHMLFDVAKADPFVGELEWTNNRISRKSLRDIEPGDESISAYRMLHVSVNRNDGVVRNYVLGLARSLLEKFEQVNPANIST